MPTISETLSRLKKSDFRAKFHLTARDRKYIDEVCDVVYELTENGLKNILNLY